MAEMNSADTAEIPVIRALNPSLRCGLWMADRYIRIMATPLTVSHKVMAAVNASGSASSASGETPAREAAVVITSSPMVVAVSKPSPNRKPIT
ncbi:hypothetical protein D9M72_364870 [compost metagenome]